MPPTSEFIGREDERDRLVELIIARPLVTIVGPGGVGKTRLAGEACREIAATFPGGIHRCELASIAPRDAIEAEVAGQLGFPSLDALAVGVGDEPALLVLDSCEHVFDAVARLCADLLESSSALHVLATSRVPLGVDGEQVFVLDPLALPATLDDADAAAAPAMRLFESRARAAGASWRPSHDELAATVELCRRLDGLPLAIELAAARTRAMTPSELLTRLDRRFELLKRASAHGSARHRSLRAVIDASYELLEPDERAFFRALGVFSGPFDEGLAHLVGAPAGIGSTESLDLLARLVDRSLVVAEQQGGVTRYRLLESLRHYAAEQATAAGEREAIAGRFVDAMVAAADRLVAAGMQRWSGRVLEDALALFGNLVAAIDRCIAGDATAERALHLLIPIFAIVHQGRAGEVVAICARVLERWPTGDEPLRGAADAIAATAYLVAGRIERARELAEAALTESPAAGLARIVALRALGIAMREQGDWARAAECFRAARDLAFEAGITPFGRELAGFEALVVGSSGDLERALATLREGIAAAADDGDTINEIWARLVTTHLLVAADRRAEAGAALTGAERAQDDVEYPYGARAALRLRAILTALERGWAASVGAWLIAIDRAAASGDLTELALTLRAGAAVALRADEEELARDLVAAVPAGVHVAVLPGLFDDELAGIGSASVAPAARAEALRRVRRRLEEGVVGAGAPRAGGVDAPARRAGADERAPSAALARTADGWTLRFAGRAILLRPSKGLDDLAVLLARPDHDVHALELIGGSDGGDAGPRMDEQARLEYRARVRDLQTEIDGARAANDVARAERAEVELDALVEQLSEAFGLGGRSRPNASAPERARSAVTWRIRAAIKRIGDAHPELGRHLQNSIRTGTWCAYRPERAIAWEIAPG